MKEENYHIRSNGEKIKISEMNTEHILIALGKSYRDIFTSQNKDELSEKLKSINNLKEEVYKRINKFNDELGE